ncbi:MAG: urea ABC transporter permease subunit UrtB [Planctomycetota bacterium]|nr:urea ABC transporter permease subunit UrtB [Planctomycetota bacterium]
MEFRWKWFVLIALVWQWAFTLGSALAADGDPREQIAQIASSDKETRQRGLEAVGANREGQLLPFLEAFQLGQIYRYQDQVVWCPGLQTVDGKSMAPLSDPLTGEELQEDGARRVVAKSELEAVGPRRRERRLIMNLVRTLQLFASDDDVRLAAVVKVGSVRKTEVLPDLELALEREADPKIQRAMRESRSLIRLGAPAGEVSDEIRLEAARTLGTLCSARGGALLKEILAKSEKESSSALSAIQLDVYQQSLDAIESYQLRVRWLGYVFSGLSLGSILVLMALGLSVIFGQMGVINMAHGELMMVGAYTTYEMQELVGHSLPDNPVNAYFLVAIPMSFLVAAFVGGLMELLVVRHLYGRPLDTLLATWGIGLVLIQLARVIYGDNVGVNSPTWLVGNMEPIQDLNLPYNRLFILGLTTGSVLAVYWGMNYTRLGLLVRATVQNRETATSLGVNTRVTDSFTFALGAGLAGVAGCALTLIGGVTPDMGQNYIVDSFLVVVTGGVGELAGAVWAGLGLGLVNKFLEPTFEAIWGKVLILAIVIIFIQWKPAGLFPPRGRLADV